MATYDKVPTFDQLIEFVVQGKPDHDIYPCIIIKSPIQAKDAQGEVIVDINAKKITTCEISKGIYNKAAIISAGWEIREYVKAEGIIEEIESRI